MTKTLSWGILGPGAIAKKFATDIQQSKYGRLVSVGSRSIDRANAFADQFDVPNRHGSYDALLEDSSVDAVYIATPHPDHTLWAIRSAEAGKHILCEKPLAINHAEVMAVIEKVESCDVFFMEAFMYRCHPQIARIVKIIRSGRIGTVKAIDANFSFSARFKPESRLWSADLAGGRHTRCGLLPGFLCPATGGSGSRTGFCRPNNRPGMRCDCRIRR